MSRTGELVLVTLLFLAIIAQVCFGEIISKDLGEFFSNSSSNHVPLKDSYAPAPYFNHSLQGISNLIPKRFRKKKERGEEEDDREDAIIRVTLSKTEFGDHQLVGNVIIGNPSVSKPFRVLFDTTSHGVMAYGAPYWKRRNERRASMSEAIEKMEDTVRIGNLQVDDVDILVVNNADGGGEKGGHSGSKFYDGMIGLNLVSVQSGTSLFAKMSTTEGGLKKKVFSFSFSPDGQHNELLLGGVDKSLLPPGRKLVYFPVVKTRWNQNNIPDWRLKFDGIQLGSNTLVHSFVAQIDNNYKYGIYSPNAEDVSTAIMNQARAPGAERVDSGRVIIECNKRKSLPDLKLLINGHEFSFTGEEYFPFQSEVGGGGGGANKNTTKKKGDNNTLPPPASGKYCELFVVDQGDGYNPKGLFTLGLPFLKKFYTVFDGRGEIGIAGGDDPRHNNNDDNKNKNDGNTKADNKSSSKWKKRLNPKTWMTRKGKNKAVLPSGQEAQGTGYN